jgi:hypothetical protein
VDHTAKKDPVVPRHAREDTHVPVNEDFLFDVDIEQRELKPVYWLGHIYEGLSSPFMQTAALQCDY